MTIPEHSQASLDTFLGRYENPKELVDLLPTLTAAKYKRIPKSLRGTEEEILEQLKIEFKDPQWTPHPTLEALRNNFWLEYDNAMRNNRKMSLGNIFTGVVKADQFSDLCDDERKFAYITCPPIDYTKNMEALLAIGLRRITDILKMPLNDDPKIAEVILKTIMAVDMRLKGGYTQRSEQKIQSQVVQHNLPSPADSKKIKDIDARIKELENKSKSVGTKSLPDVLIGLPQEVTKK